MSSPEDGSDLTVPRLGPRLETWLLYACLGLAAVDLILDKHGHVELENWFGFFPVFGLLATLTLVIGGLVLRAIVGRAEGYYDE